MEWARAQLWAGSRAWAWSQHYSGQLWVQDSLSSAWSHYSHTHHPSSGSQLTASCRGPWPCRITGSCCHQNSPSAAHSSFSELVTITQCSGSQFRFLFGARWPGQGSSAQCTGLAAIIHNKRTGARGKNCACALYRLWTVREKRGAAVLVSVFMTRGWGPSENNVKCEHVKGSGDNRTLEAGKQQQQ